MTGGFSQIRQTNQALNKKLFYRHQPFLNFGDIELSIPFGQLGLDI